jgi:hypothetical protein
MTTSLETGLRNFVNENHEEQYCIALLEFGMIDMHHTFGFLIYYYV